MNVLGPEVAYFASYYKILPGDVVAVHDDLDLPVGSLRIRSGGGDGGHNGIKSITASLGTKDYVRVKVGIGRPIGGPEDSEEVRSSKVTSWVLGRFTSEERPVIDGAVIRAAQAVGVFFESGLVSAQQKFNG
jgi:PTH1 family peptidyl-tRNA hydrolase